MDVIFLATAWGPRFGGVNAFNQDFAIGIARQLGDSGRVFCAVPNATTSEISAAQSAHVTIVPLPEKQPVERFDPSWAFDIIESLKSEKIDLQKTIWIGHDLVSGQAALNGAKLSGGRSALLMHMSYIQYQAVKHGIGQVADTKHREQKKLFSSNEATCFAVGPLLQKACKQIGAKQVHQLVPGFPGARIAQNSSEDDIVAITFGRLDKQSDIIKQGRLAVAAFGRAIDLANSSYGPTLAAFRAARLYVVGLEAKDSSAKEIQRFVRKFAKRTVNLIGLPYSESRDELFERLGEANLAMMLSWHEGFGLTGWEAIAAEIPLIVSKSSGVYQLIERELGGAGIGCLHPVEIRGTSVIDERQDEISEQDISTVANRIFHIATDIARAKRDAHQLRNMLVGKLGCTWDDTAKAFLSVMGWEDTAARISTDTALPRSTTPEPSPSRTEIVSISTENSISQCVELLPGTTQGSSLTSFDLLPELRFGETELDIRGSTFSVGLSEALLAIALSDCSLAPGPRLGDTPHPNVRVDGNRWRIIGPSENGVLVRRALGTEPLAKVRAKKGSRPIVEMEILAHQGWISYRQTDGKKKNLSRNKQAVLEIFLNKCLGVVDGTIVLSRAAMGPKGAKDEID
jgi:glycosyltransferase involved in cell wall biosynthesis